MGEKSREKAKKLEKLERARLFHRPFNNDAPTNSGGSLIDSDVTELQGKETIPSSAAENPNIPEPAEEILSINFRPRSLDHEQIDRMGNVDARALVHKIFCANRMNKSEAKSNIIRDKVNNTGRYTFLYRGLSEDIDILEIQFREEGRIFGFFAGNTFNVVAVRTNHI